MLTAMLASKHRGRRKGIPVRQGAVRQARLEANLTLADMAGDAVSRSAIHLVETGRTRPSMETLEQIARKTSKPIEFFLLEGQQANARRTVEAEYIRELESLTVVRDFKAVIQRGMSLLSDGLDQGQAAQINFYLGQAYCQLVRPREALQYLPAARKWFEQTGDEWMAIEAMDWEGAALGLLDDPRSLAVAEEALDRCRRVDPRPVLVEVRILGHIAAMHVTNHSWAQAIRSYEAAVEASGKVRDLHQLAKMHHGLGTAYQRLDQPTRARQEFDRAMALYAMEADLSATYRVENDLGDLLLQQGQLEAAEQHFKIALAGSSQLDIDRRGRGYILANLGEVYMRQGRLDESRRSLAQAMEAAEKLGERIVLANALTVLGRLEAREENKDLARGHFDRVLGILRDLDMPDRLRDCHMVYAELLSELGDKDLASDHWKAAAEIGKAINLGKHWAVETGDRETVNTADGAGGPAA